ncbi:hypothetical protein BX616_006471 [Lobosporangium transversale]|uniref:Yeast cell wall synthesis Kre9/Knh1-like N-terminal domain-containing protein n=1 Tax=Lobosporangium transversale TaxID=64571 RepID=A0A1Y2G851_9FUNG|nr:hypothetical protein BCR41DRAFT_363243 [Lobosporangium transversale]KAF9896939.1 hypothetical protein BX616_006471 [Lobosporangium transversale]ORZ02050.1 hypothetical protein BCR41DRAFT_363243 [Lobosporangium transversale]|eukprot:XP_021876278.1 hypothetical protein BCR41DRAFT_363243 [Lobosporangium transversale]
MKFIATLAVAVSSLAAMASADMLQINNPTVNTIWNAGKTEYVAWTGNCASMGPAGKNVTVEIVTGPSTSVRHVGNIGTVDCSGSNSTANVIIPEDFASGQYALIILTEPEKSYTNAFTINNPKVAAPPTTAPPASNPSGSGSTAPKEEKPSSAGSLGANTFLALTGAATAAFYLL